MGCPSHDRLAQFHDGKVGGKEAAELLDHLSSCDACAAVYRRIDATLPAVASPEEAVAARTPGPADPGPGLLVGRRYRLETLLGEGGMGTVWAAQHLVTGQRVALKILRQGHMRRPGMRKRMLREARTASSLQHPNVVRVLDAFEADGGIPVLVMDLLKGRTLKERIREGPLTVAEVARLLVPAMAAVQSVHAAGVIHRDLKPDNLFLVALADGGYDVRVVDFGLARPVAVDAESSQVTRSGEMLGTPSYMSPEQAFGESDLDERSDVWAMGVILYECLSGHRPFEGENVGQILKRITTGQRVPLAEAAPGAPDDVVAVIERMLSVPLADRPADLGEAIAVLERHAAQPTGAIIVRPRRRAWLAVAAAVAVVAATAGLLAVRGARHHRTSADAAGVVIAPDKAGPVNTPIAPARDGAKSVGTATAAVASPAMIDRPAPVEAHGQAPPRERSPSSESRAKSRVVIALARQADSRTPSVRSDSSDLPAAKRPRVQRADDL